MKSKYSILLIPLCLALLFPQTARAEGEGNIDGGGGHMNQGVEGYNWPSGHEGVRITIVDAESGIQVTSPIDFTNYDVNTIADLIFNFGQVSKIQYRNGAALTIQTSYHYYKPDVPLPKIISTNSGKVDMEVIKKYFCSEGAADMVAAYTGINTADLVSGNYKLVIEPIIYVWYNHLFFAMSVTEAGLYNRMTGGDLGSHFPTVIMKNFALSMFLERSDLGFPAWTGPKGSARSTEEMISILGIGIVSYSGESEVDPPVTDMEYDQEYRVNTDVITAVRLHTSSEINNKSKATVTFRIDGQTYKMTGVVMPAGGNQLVWVKWHTPSTPKDITIQVTSNKGTLSSATVRARIVDLNSNPPPDPQANDRNNGFQIPPPPSKQNVTSLSWGEWYCWWQENWVYHEGSEDEDGYWCDHGWFEYDWIPYTATMTTTMKIVTDEKNPTAENRFMKSGYGINMEVSARVISNAASKDVTGAQNVLAYFPEFAYQTYWRLLERVESGYSSRFEFQKNQYSTYKRRSHFSPVWFPDGDYIVYGITQDAWTPAGMLQSHMTDDLQIRDNLFADWHIRPIN